MTDRIETSILGFDEMIGGGLPRRGVTILAGLPGSPRQPLLDNAIWNILEDGLRVLLLAISTSPYEFLRRSEEYGKDARRAYEKGDLVVLNAFCVRAGIYHRAIGEIIQDIEPHRIREIVPEYDPDVVVIDSIYPMHRGEHEKFLQVVSVLKATAVKNDIAVLAGCALPESALRSPNAEVADVLLETAVHEFRGTLVYSLLPIRTLPPHLPKYRAPMSILEDGTVVVHCDKVLDVKAGEIHDVDEYLNDILNMPEHMAREVTEDSEVLEELEERDDIERLLEELEEMEG
ncbi:RAD55 family ATPase [Methanopyrus sp. KOL6]|uniref:RAD55 family ATPase n=1 Tax=Methanopyrus sp. KOL6 TaxID=1937004 RepID=UPI000B4B7D4C|nr:RAD55 family ATPase [Methanopyrus sp. KOL6]